MGRVSGVEMGVEKIQERKQVPVRGPSSLHKRNCAMMAEQQQAAAAAGGHASTDGFSRCGVAAAGRGGRKFQLMGL